MEGKIAVITGASSGLGEAASEEFAKKGAFLVLAARTVSKLEENAARFSSLGAKGCEVVPTDVLNAESIANLFEVVKKKFGRVDILVANAGVSGIRAPVTDITEEEWHACLNCNLRSCFLTVKYAVPLMRQHGGCIMITSSMSGTRVFSQPGASAYAAAKAGQLAFGQMLALELAPDGIRVNVICPGHIQTNIGNHTVRRNIAEAANGKECPQGTIPLTGGKALPADSFGKLAAFLCSEDAKHISGTPVFLDGAESLFL